VSYHVPSLVTAAAVALAAAVGVVGVADSTEPTAGEFTGAPLTAPVLPDPTELVAPTEERRYLAPRASVPQRELGVAIAPALAPEPEPVNPERPAPRELRGTGELLAAAGTSQDPIAAGGRTVLFSVEVEAATELDPDVVAVLAERALYDGRSWARTVELRRVAPADASVHLVIASPASVDRLCARAGLNTAGWLSCWTGSVAAINVDRWTQGVDHIEDLAVYRSYLVNHEVGHGLGFGHVDCPGPDELAPVMQQQTKSLSGCIANAWRFPDA
jgi:hypothetical protein